VGARQSWYRAFKKDVITIYKYKSYLYISVVSATSDGHD